MGSCCPTIIVHLRIKSSGRPKNRQKRQKKEDPVTTTVFPTDSEANKTKAWPHPYLLPSDGVGEKVEVMVKTLSCFNQESAALQRVASFPDPSLRGDPEAALHLVGCEANGGRAGAPCLEQLVLLPLMQHNTRPCPSPNPLMRYLKLFVPVRRR
ncbi:hypothetical protein HPP92_014419 [Vanilla planifolia]|uniref:Uncharacterized protein n=1 Tax=Vanilla planifolia TaxID=51239 RepID=A0A835QPI1_VANPL|nr:hypothetical protein HPP92_014419 [Vanilla planifolia]